MKLIQKNALLMQKISTYFVDEGNHHSSTVSLFYLFIAHDHNEMSIQNTANMTPPKIQLETFVFELL
jgi:hypothetical protein